MDVKLRPYIKSFSHSYTIGVYPTLELLEKKKEKIIRVLLSSKGEQNKGARKIIELCRNENIKMQTDDGLVDKLAQSGNAYTIGVFNKYQEVIRPGKNHLVLDQPSDAGNLGTIIRTMLAFDVQNLAIIRPGVDIFNPKAIRASMGAIFDINFEYFEYFSDYQAVHKNKIYTFVTDAEKLLDKAEFVSPYSLVFGNEGAGLSKVYRKAGERVRIAQSDKVDSLNLSIAVGVALHKQYST